MSKALSKEWLQRYGDHPQLADPEFPAQDYPEQITSDIPARLRRGGVGRVQRPQECHHRAFVYALAHHDEPGLELVYGTHRGSLEHSWIELPGNITFDGNRMQFNRTDDYRRALQAVPRWRFTAMEAMGLMARTGHSGPWTAQDCIDVIGHIPNS